MAKHTQTILRQIADELLECFGHFMGLAIKGLRHVTLFEKDSNTGVFFRILQNFSEKLFLWNTSGGCF